MIEFLPREIELNIHIYPGPEDGDVIVNAVCEEIHTRDLYNSAFIAGEDDVIKLGISRNGKVRRCLLDSHNRPVGYARRASEMGCSNSQPLNTITTRQFCDEAHQLGLIVHPFYADDEAEMERLIECGVDGILTNEPEGMMRLLG